MSTPEDFLKSVFGSGDGEDIPPPECTVLIEIVVIRCISIIILFL